MLFNWLKRKAELAALKSHTADVDRFIDSLSGMTDVEIAGVVALATIVRSNLEESGSIPSDLFENPLYQYSRDGSLMVLRLSNYVMEAQKQDLAMEKTGGMVWLFSMRCYAFPELRHRGQEMWRELRRGFSNSTTEFFFSQGLKVPSNVEERAAYVPVLLR